MKIATITLALGSLLSIPSPVTARAPEVWIDDEKVGTWYHADHNETLRWFDSDFDVHPRFTAGKSELAVKLLVKRDGGRGPFTDFEYRVFCFGD